MTTAVIGTGTLGSVIARLLASGGETLRLSSAHSESGRLEVGGDLHDLVVGPAEARTLAGGA
jgi:8-hydroxy-5-deazaflavin:NADPH oxidoreductase